KAALELVEQGARQTSERLDALQGAVALLDDKKAALELVEQGARQTSERLDALQGVVSVLEDNKAAISWVEEGVRQTYLRLDAVAVTSRENEERIQELRRTMAELDAAKA